MKKKLITASLTGMLLAVSSVYAAPISLPNNEPVFIQFNNLEMLDTSNGIVVPGGAIDVNGDGVTDTPTNEGNWGVFNVSSIQHGAVATSHEDISGGSAFFVDDGPTGSFNQGQVSGIFYGLTLTSGTTATGGWIDFYWEDAGSDDLTTADINGTTAASNPANRTAANQLGPWTDGTLLARLEFASGIISGDPLTTLVSNIDLNAITGIGNSDAFANVIDINGDGVIDAADGAWAEALNTDWFHVDVDGDGVAGEVGETRDLRFSTFFNLIGDAANPWDIRSNDPARAFTAVPEPSSLALLGLGLIGFAAARRRKSA